MRFGFVLPNNWGLEDPQDVLDVAVTAEQMGFDSVWVNHHVLNVGYVLDRLDNRPYYDTLTVLTYVAARTKTVRLGTSVLVLPYLNPLALAKSLATLDVLSGGRLTVGVGVGALKQESDALGADFNRRGAYTDESLRIMKALWTQPDPSHRGDLYSFSGVKFSPKPAQRPHPPIWVGGNSPAALRRAALLGDGWHPTELSPEEMSHSVEYLKARLDVAARAPSDIALSVRLELDVRSPGETGAPGPMMGTPDRLLKSMERYRNVGVHEIALSVSTADVGRINRMMEAFASKVMQRARD